MTGSLAAAPDVGFDGSGGVLDAEGTAGHVFGAAREMVDDLLPGLRFGEVLRMILDAVAVGGANWSACRDELRFTLAVSALASGGEHGEPRGEAVRLAAAVALVEIGLGLLDHVDAGGRWILPVEYSPKVLSLVGHSLLTILPAALVHAPPHPDDAGGRVLPDLFRMLARVASDRLEQVELGRAAQAELVESGPIIRLRVRVRRPSYAVMAARLAGAPDGAVEGYARLGRALGIADRLRRDLVDLFDEAGGHAFADGTVTAPLAVYAAQAGAQDRAEMHRLLDEARGSRTARVALCHRLQKSGVVRQLVATIQEHCAYAHGQADGMRLPPGLDRILRREIGAVSLG